MLKVTGLRKAYGSGANAVVAVDDVTFEVASGEFLSMIGPSGCGKTTLLRCVSALLSPSAGSIELEGRRVTEPPREMALVFQDYTRSLFPWMSVATNVTLPLWRRVRSRDQRRRIGGEVLEAVGIGAFGDKYPWQLSGGMQQRVAIARALAYQPEILLMDEPFASVDAQTRIELEDLILRIRDEFKVTVIFVTHDIDEAVYLADRVVLLSAAPSRVREELPIPLPRPRHQTATKELADFARLRRYLYESLKQDRRRDPQDQGEDGVRSDIGVSGA